MLLTIKGQVPSKSNGYKIAGKRLYKSSELKDYEWHFLFQTPKIIQKIEGKFGITMSVYFQSNRSDLDNAAKVILDCLQVSGIIKNDRNCWQLQMTKQIDKLNPRVEIFIYEID
ncbi:Rus Holliday junction resolvase [uncultured Caudovirales phage]|jgi:Holliday junction resolvase RusA-like endonuclease|uniref:Rus Holliday junction resolvase n=1 Tax=uncultured Caudovirales phage TaxID=2100421 RepID=A0A6J5LWX1_9CAUD|nr:Rus Holliday junction resolvase [uncultured Caudovirales phage]